MDVIEELKSLGKFTKKKFGGGGGLGWEGVGLVGWGQGGCEQRIEVFVKIQKIKFGGGGGWVGGGGGGSGVGGSVWCRGVRMDVNEE